MSFGQKSESDKTTEVLFTDYGAKYAGDKNAKSYFGMLSLFNVNIEKLQNKLVWDDVIDYEE